MPPSPPSADPGLVEVADRVWVVRPAGSDVNVTVAAGDRGVLVVDTGGSERAGGELVDVLRQLGRGEVLAVVNTHGHVAHTAGNQVVRSASPGAQLVTHEDADVPAADRAFSSVWALDLGDRVAEVVHPGRGHTAADVVVRVPDADVLVAGDLVEGSAPPSYGPDSFPLDWPASLDLVISLLAETTVVVPGHGDVVDGDHVRTLRAGVGVVAETVYDLASRSVPIEEALRHQDWPFPAGGLEHAVRRGYDQVPRTARRLPLL